MPTRQSILLMACAFLSAIGGLAADDAPKDRAPSEAEIRTWVADLDSDRFLLRERATRKLGLVGAPALDMLATTADGSKLEAATRAVRVLLKYCEQGDEALALAALERVAALSNRPAESTAAESMLAGIRTAHAQAAILKLGGERVTTNVARGRSQGNGIAHLKLSDKWKGGDDGVKHIRHLRSLVTLSVYTDAVTDKGLEKLRALPLLQRIELYGSGVTTEGVAALRKQLPHVAIEVRSRAQLGISCSPLAKRAEILAVQAKSAASAADLRPGDIVAAFNDKPVGNFKGLTAMIAALEPGEKVRLQILRGGQSMVKEVTLGEWR